MMNIHSMKELALLYLPDINPKGAAVQFRRWIRETPHLMKILQDETGFILSQRHITPRQRDIIMIHIGKP